MASDSAGDRNGSIADAEMLKKDTNATPPTVTELSAIAADAPPRKYSEYLAMLEGRAEVSQIGTAQKPQDLSIVPVESDPVIVRDVPSPAAPPREAPKRRPAPKGSIVKNLPE